MWRSGSPRFREHTGPHASRRGLVPVRTWARDEQISTDTTARVRARAASRDRPGWRTCSSRKRRASMRLEAGTHRGCPGADRAGEIPLCKRPGVEATRARNVSRASRSEPSRRNFALERPGARSDRRKSASRTAGRQVGSRKVRSESVPVSGRIEKSPLRERPGVRSDRKKSVCGAFGYQVGSRNVRIRNVPAPSRVGKRPLREQTDGRST